MRQDDIDRLEIELVLRKYALGLDERRFDLWDEVFTDAAVIDFTPMGGKRETPHELSSRLSATSPGWLFAQHPLYNTVVDLDGDSAVAFSDYGLETGRRSPDASYQIVLTSGGGSYRDSVVRTAKGWRICERVVTMKWKQTRTVADELARLRD
ncbi:nuclear transport factor 2 family protein [Mycobacterium intracellulare]|uniref:nuclear transport factor 2 family protein n=1 Tax=Mycobacterium intracellulare TaxID=1767 RepID=UPI0010425EFE|nr:nuclear transport factor 2 family protein [Mycobacterium intracellulare]